MVLPCSGVHVTDAAGVIVELDITVTIAAISTTPSMQRWQPMQHPGFGRQYAWKR
jgi:hypothetical protein